MSSEKEASSSTEKRKLSCTACFDALWFCYSPVHQMQQYYRLGALDNCSGKWKAMFDCLMLKTKPTSQVEGEPGTLLVSWPLNRENYSSQSQAAEMVSWPKANMALEVLDAREKSKPHIWTFRTRYEASQNWQNLYGHLDRPE